MSRPKDSRNKVEVSRPSAPLQHNPFALLGELDALKDLPAPAAPEPEPDKAPSGADDGHRPPLQKPPKPVNAKNSRVRL